MVIVLERPVPSSTVYCNTEYIYPRSLAHVFTTSKDFFVPNTTNVVTWLALADVRGADALTQRLCEIDTALSDRWFA